MFEIFNKDKYLAKVRKEMFEWNLDHQEYGYENKIYDDGLFETHTEKQRKHQIIFFAITCSIIILFIILQVVSLK